jgi:hypothetical protein
LRNAAGAVVRTVSGFVQDSRTKYNFEDQGAYAQGTYKLTDRRS